MNSKSPLLAFFDVQTAFYKPLWIRASLTIVCLLWGLIELSKGAELWAMLFATLGFYLGYQFFVVFNPKDDDNQGNGSP